MRRILVILALFAASAGAQELRSGETITVERIIIDARVTDAAGDPLLGLAPSDFVVKVDGRTAKIESLDWVPETAAARELAGVFDPVKKPETIGEEVVPPGRLFVVFVQTDPARNSMRTGGQMKMLPYVREILDGFEPEDRVAVFSFDSHLKFRLDFSTDRDRAYDAIESALAVDEPAWPQVVPNPSLARRLDREEMKKAATSEKAMILLGNALRNIPGPKSMLLLGWGLGHRMGNRVSMDSSYVIARHVLESARTTIFAIDTTLASYHDLEVGLQKAAADTGGFYAKTETFPMAAVQRLQRTLSGHYELEVRKPDGLRPGTHTIDVQVKKRGATVLARKSYVDDPQ